MKKFSAIVILFSFIMNSFGFVLLQPILINYYKHLGMVRAGFPSEEELIEFVVFNKSDIENRMINFQWIHSREYRYNGFMYDIVKRSEDDSMFYFHVINDTKEKELEEKFNEKVEDNSTEPKQNQTENNSLKNLYSELLKNTKIIHDDNPSVQYLLHFTNKYISAWQDVPTPPPRKS